MRCRIRWLAVPATMLILAAVVSSRRTSAPTPAPASSLPQLPPAAASANESGTATLDTPKAGLRAAFDAAGIEVRPREKNRWRLRLRVRGIGRDDADYPAAGGRPKVEGTRVTYHHGWGREWYERRDEGIEQLFEINERPDGDGPLGIFMTIEGLGVAVVHPDRAIFADGKKPVLGFEKLRVRDAEGTIVPAHMAAAESGLALVVDDRSAVYPITVDPLLGPPPSLPDPAAWETNGQVVAIAPGPGGVTFIGGDFTYVGPHTGTGAAVDATSGRLALPPADFDGIIHAVAPDGQGGWYVGGEFTQVMGAARSGLAHLRNDGLLDPTWTPEPNGIVHAIAVSESVVYVGGEFTSIGGATRNYIAALDAVTGAATGWNPGAGARVRAIVVAGGTVYAGGDFVGLGGAARSRIGAIDAASGLATSWNPGASLAVFALTMDGSTVYAGGAFTQMGGLVRNRIASIDAVTGAIGGWNPGADNIVRALQVDGTNVYAGGNFTVIGGTARNFLAAVDNSTGAVSSWNPDPDGIVQALDRNGGTLYVGGNFSVIGGVSRRGVAAFDTGTGMATSWDPNPDDIVRSLSVDSSAVFVGGDFSFIGGVNRNRLAAIDSLTGRATDWNPDADSVVFDLDADGAVVYAAGAFTSIGGVARNRIAAVDASTGAPTAWNPDSDGSVQAMAVDGSTVYVGGSFFNIGGAPRNCIAALDSGSGLATSWNPGATNSIEALAVDGIAVYAGGLFGNIGGTARNYLAALDKSTGIPFAWDPDADDVVRSLVLDGFTLYVGGEFTTIALASRNRLAAIDTQILSDPLPGLHPWNPGANGPVHSVAVDGSTVFAAGSFSSAGGIARNRLAAIDSGTGVPTTWDPNVDTPSSRWVNTVVVDESRVYTGGSFGGMGGTSRKNLAVFSISRAASVTSPLADGAYGAGQVIPIEVTFPGSVTVTGAPRLHLETGLTDSLATYSSGSGTNTLSFIYTVSGSDRSEDLEVTYPPFIDLNGGTLTDSLGNPVTPQLPPPGVPGSLSTNKDLVIDNDAPPAPVITDPVPGATTGPSPVVSGTAEPLATIEVFDGATALGTTPVDAGGGWTFGSGSLSDGPHSFTAVATDAAGNVGPASAPVNITVDGTGPTITITSPADGAAISGNLVSLVGITEAGAMVDIFDGAVLLASLTADGAGLWSFAALQSEGPTTYTVTGTDALGNVGPVAAVTVTVDLTPPGVPSIDSPADGTLTVSSVVTLSGTGEANGSVQVFDGPMLIGTAPIDGAGDWTFSTIPLTNGTHVFTVQTLDAAGNISGASTAVSVTVAAGTGPVVDITVPTPAPTHVSAAAVLGLGGTATDAGAGTQVTWLNKATGVSGSATGTTTWSASVPLTGGTNVIVATVTGPAGSASDQIAVAYAAPADVAPPSIAVTSPPGSPAPSSTSPFTISGTAADDNAVSRVTWFNASTGGDGVATGTLAWSADVPTAPGSNLVTLTAHDPSGNTVEALVTIILTPAGVDVTPPTILILDPTIGPSLVSSVDVVRIGGAASDETQLVTVVWANTATGRSGTATGMNIWSAEITLDQGPNTILVGAYDAEGNLGQDMLTVSYDPTGGTPTTTVIKKESRCGLLGLEVLLLLLLAAFRQEKDA